jgi:hypothetical protein
MPLPPTSCPSSSHSGRLMFVICADSLRHSTIAALHGSRWALACVECEEPDRPRGPIDRLGEVRSRHRGPAQRSPALRRSGRLPARRGVHRGRDWQGSRCPRQAPTAGRCLGDRPLAAVSGHSSQARSFIARRGLCGRTDGATCALHCCRTGSGCRPVHVAPLCCPGREGAATDRGADAVGACGAEGSGHQAR